MATIRNSLTEANLKRAIAAESLASRRCLAYAERAEMKGYDQVAALFRTIADRRASHVRRHLATFEPCDNVVMDKTGGSTSYNVHAVILSELDESDGHYPAMARIAHQQGLDEIAGWFELLAKAGRGHAGRFRHMLDTLL
jgi:rubrerythrin